VWSKQGKALVPGHTCVVWWQYIHVHTPVSFFYGKSMEGYIRLRVATEQSSLCLCPVPGISFMLLLLCLLELVPLNTGPQAHKKLVVY
jgi:hypothetical protein